VIYLQHPCDGLVEDVAQEPEISRITMMFQPRSPSRLRCFHWFWAVSWTDVYLGKLGSSWDQQHNKTPPLKLGLVNLLEHNPPSMQHKIDIGQNFNVWFYFCNALSELEKVQG